MRILTLLVFLFGSQLYAFGDLDNPATQGTYYFLYKDIAIILLGLSIIGLGSKSKVPVKSYTWLLFYLGLSVYILLSVAIFGGSLGSKYQKILKNGVVYLGFCSIVVSYFLTTTRLENLVRILLDCLTFSFIISLLLHWYSPVKSATGRLFGTFGNPNSVGFAVAFVFALVFVSRHLNGQLKIREITAFSLACVLLILSASLGSLLGILLFLFALYLSRFNLTVVLTSIMLTGLVTIVLLAAFYLLFLQDTQSTGFHLLDRLKSIATQGLENDSIAVRLADLVVSVSMSCDVRQTFAPVFGCLPSDDFKRFDSTIFSYIYNFGYLITTLFLIFIFGPVLLKLANQKKIMSGQHSRLVIDENKAIKPLLVFLLTFVPINLLLQHNIDIFPTSFIYAVIFAIIYRSPHKKECALESAASG